MKWFKKNKEEVVSKNKGTIFHQEIQDISLSAQKIKEELFKKNLEERVEKKIKSIR